MKKYIKLFIAALFLGFVIHTVYASQRATTSDLLLDNIKAFDKGKINPLCPNGCIEPIKKPKGCFCYKYYPQYNEYDWGNNQEGDIPLE
ncbi:hypothetical protein [Bacteroides heparinolyticus]|uniref:hypothetical protein n=1 Tax=Prevotella heparinolytica TaxID=28113 RepID=UPI0035A00283